MTNADNGNNPWYREPWPWMLMAGPALVIVAGFITLWYAIVSNDGLVTDDYYKEGLAVNQRLHRDHVAADLGLSGTVMHSGTQLRLMLTAQDVSTLPQELILRLAHPTRNGQDQKVAMKAEAPGFYNGVLKEAIAGRWLVIIEDPKGNWRLQGEWVANEDEPLQLQARAQN